jgi:hypothetical protein
MLSRRESRPSARVRNRSSLSIMKNLYPQIAQMNTD